MNFIKILKNFKEGLFPKKCIICYKYGYWLCEKHKKIQDSRIQDPQKHRYLESQFSPTNYKDKTAKKIIHYLKFKGFKEVGELCADIILERIGLEFFKDKVLVPVPLYWTRHFSRGFNQAEIIAFYLQKKLRETHHINIGINKNLKKIKNTEQQALLDKSERKNNLENVFKWKGQTQIFRFNKHQDLIPPPNIILIDDVFTTGTTLNMAAKELKMSGCKKVYGLTFARND